MRYSTQISAIIVSLVFLYALNFKSLVTINFYWNQTEIAELFCINKDKPQLKCNGKCHLVKQLVKADMNDEDIPFSQNNTEYNLDLIFEALTTDNLSINSNTIKRKWYSTNQNLLDRSLDILTPPPKV